MDAVAIGAADVSTGTTVPLLLYVLVLCTLKIFFKSFLSSYMYCMLKIGQTVNVFQRLLGIITYRLMLEEVLKSLPLR